MGKRTNFLVPSSGFTQIIHTVQILVHTYHYLFLLYIDTQLSQIQTFPESSTFAILCHAQDLKNVVSKKRGWANSQIQEKILRFCIVTNCRVLFPYYISPPPSPSWQMPPDWKDVDTNWMMQFIYKLQYIPPFSNKLIHPSPPADKGHCCKTNYKNGIQRSDRTYRHTDIQYTTQ